MVEAVNRFAIVQYRRIWFPEELPKLSVFDFVSLRQVNETLEKELNPKHWIISEFSTLHTDLKENEDDLFAKIAKNTKYEINRAMKEGIKTEITNLYEFLPFFNTFAPTKGLKLLSLRNLQAYHSSSVFTKATRGEDVYAMHAYIVDNSNAQNSRARLLYSATVDRTKSELDLNLIGRANRLLHWQDMLYFKQMGICIYDWGGICGDENNPYTAGIDAFKMAYGGVRVREPHFEQKKLLTFKKLLGR